MEAIRLHPNPDTSNPYSEANPAPASALKLDSNLPIPKPLHPGELLIKVEATTVIRDALTWPETYLHEYAILGNDFAGTVVEVNAAPNGPSFNPGDEVYGMSNASRAGTWSTHAIVLAEETCLKPKSLAWAQAAATPLSALTAYQALFEKAGIEVPDFTDPKTLKALQDSKTSPSTSATKKKTGTLLITGASGNVGLYTLQLARLTSMTVVCATRSNPRNKPTLEQLGADEVVEYDTLTQSQPQRHFDVIIDTIGGPFLQTCWSLINPTAGRLITIESASYDFVSEHRKLGLLEGKEGVNAVYFVVEPRHAHLRQVSAVVDAGLFEPLVACVMPLRDAGLAYERGSNSKSSSSTSTARGKIVLTPGAG